MTSTPFGMRSSETRQSLRAFYFRSYCTEPKIRVLSLTDVSSILGSSLCLANVQTNAGINTTFRLPWGCHAVRDSSVGESLLELLRGHLHGLVCWL